MRYKRIRSINMQVVLRMLNFNYKNTQPAKSIRI